MQLPSVWTSQKIASLLWLSWLGVDNVSAGQAFENCVGSGFSIITNFPFQNDSSINSGRSLGMCCSTDFKSPVKCFSGQNCITSGSGEFVNFVCQKVAQAVVCGGCSGIIGDTLITGISIINGNSEYKNGTLSSSCPTTNISAVANYLTTVTPGGLDKGYADWVCPTGTICDGLNCGWDNGGWTCYPDFSNNSILKNCSLDSNNNYACDDNCVLQWPSFPPQGLNLSTFNGSVLVATSAISSLISSMTTYNSSNAISSFLISSSLASALVFNSTSSFNPLFLVEIILPVGVVGLGSLGGVTYCLVRRRRSNLKSLTTGQELEKMSPLSPQRDMILTPTESEIVNVLPPSLPLPTYSPVHSSSDLACSPSMIESSSSLNSSQVINQIRAKLVPEQKLLNDFLDAYELLQKNSGLASAKRNYERAQEALGTKISWAEMSSLVKALEQTQIVTETFSKPHEKEQYSAQFEVATTSSPALRSSDY